MRVLEKNCWLRFLVVCSIFFSSINVFAHQEVKTTFTFGVVPQQSALVLAKKWLPILNYVSKKTGVKLQFKTTSSIPDFENELHAKSYDFAYMNPYHYTVFHKKPGYQALLKQGEKQIKGILVVHRDSDIIKLTELEALRIAFPAPAAFAATVIPKAVLKKKGINHESVYVSSHESVYKNVAYGRFKVGGGIERTLANVSPQIRQELRILWTTKGYTPHAIAASPDVSEKVKLAFEEAFLSLNKTPEGKALLEQLKFKSVVKAKNSDWDDVRDLDINLLNNLKKVSG